MFSITQKLSLGFAAIVLVALVNGALSVMALRTAAENEEQLARDFGERLLWAERARFHAEQMVATGRGRMLTGDPRSQLAFEEASRRLHDDLGLALNHPQAQAESYLEEAKRASRAYVDVLDGFERLPADARAEGQSAFVLTVLKPLRDRIDGALDGLVVDERDAYNAAFAQARAAVHKAEELMAALAAAGVILGVWLGVLVLRSLSDHLGREQGALSEARRATAERDEVLAFVSHDLRNPLGAVIMGAEVLRRTIPADQERARKAASTILSAAERMNHLVMDLLQVANLEAVGAKLQRRSQDLAGLQLDVQALFGARAEELRLTLSWEAPSGARLDCDRERLLQVLSNLIGNAFKFTPEGGQVLVTCTPDARGMGFSVSDTGPGIPGPDLTHLFDRYWKGQRGGAGFGLGLYISRLLVEAHGGRLWAESELGHGTTMRFTLPSERAS